jgi:hypothetical protein
MKAPSTVSGLAPDESVFPVAATAGFLHYDRVQPHGGVVAGLARHLYVDAGQPASGCLRGHRAPVRARTMLIVVLGAGRRSLQQTEWIHGFLGHGSLSRARTSSPLTAASTPDDQRYGFA